MGIQSWSDGVILVDLPRELEEHKELQTVLKMVQEKGDSNVVIDFSSVNIVGSTTFASLLQLRQVLQDSGHKLVLCGLSPATKGVFEFVEDRFAALASPQMMP